MRKTKESGITLIALMITVIVMSILAFVTMNMFIGDNGIFRKTEEAGEIYKNAANQEGDILNKIEEEYDRIKDNTTGDMKFATNFIHECTGKVEKIDAVLNVYTDSECKNLLKQINISSKEASEEYSYQTKKHCQVGHICNRRTSAFIWLWYED